MSKGTIIGFSFLAMFIIGGPIAKAMGSSNPVVGVVIGIVVFIVLSAIFGGR